MIQILIADDKVIKLDDVTGVTWLLLEDDDGAPVWIEIRHDKCKEDK
jgi:hypothetical protein